MRDLCSKFRLNTFAGGKKKILQFCNFAGGKKKKKNPVQEAALQPEGSVLYLARFASIAIRQVTGRAVVLCPAYFIPVLGFKRGVCSTLF